VGEPVAECVEIPPPLRTCNREAGDVYSFFSDVTR
jgi:hypothetical protein